jgi:hypothetical protein
VITTSFGPCESRVPSLETFSPTMSGAYRSKHGLSQEGLTDACDPHRTYVGSVEQCERKLTLSTLDLFSDALHVTVPALLSKA